MDKIIRTALILLTAMVANAQDVKNPYRFKYVGDSLVCYYTTYYRDKAQNWNFSLSAWNLPSGRKMEGSNADKVKALQIDSSFCAYYPGAYYRVEPTGFGSVNKSATNYHILARTQGAVLASIGNKDLGLYNFDGKGFRSIGKAKSVEKARKENEQQAQPFTAWGVAQQKRIYYAHLGALYSIADDGSDDDHPVQELPAAGLAIMALQLSEGGRYAIMQLAPTIQSGKKMTVNPDQGTWAIRCFDLKEKKPLMAIKPTQINRLQFSADARYMLYWNENDSRYYYYDLQEKTEIGKYPVSVFTDDYSQHRMDYTIDNRYFYRVAGVPDNYGFSKFDLKIVDLRNTPSK